MSVGDTVLLEMRLANAKRCHEYWVKEAKYLEEIAERTDWKSDWAEVMRAEKYANDWLKSVKGLEALREDWKRRGDDESS